MQFKTITLQKLPFFVALGLMAVLTSCGSFQYAGYENDGIYTADDYNTVVEQPEVTTSTSDSNYYKNYFAENSAEVDAIQEESEIFTDIDSYEGNYSERVQDTLEQRPAYGGWGQNNSTVTINVIDNGWYGWNDPWLWNGGFGVASYGYGWNRWGYNYGWGWNSPWAYGGLYGYGFYPAWGYNYGWGYNNWGWNNGYYRNSNRYAYAGSRRGSSLYNNNLNRIGRSNSALSRRDYSTRRLSSANTTRNSLNTRVRSNSSTRSINNNGVTRSTRTTRTPTRTTRSTRVTRPASTTRSTRSVRSTTPTRTSRSSGSVRSTRSSRSSSSGSVRSSGSSSSRSSSSRSSSSSSGRKGRG